MTIAHNAHQRVYTAVRNGTLIKPKKCEICFREVRLDAHHHNGYDEPHVLDVQWLCRRCHFKLHSPPGERSITSVENIKVAQAAYKEFMNNPVHPTDCACVRCKWNNPNYVHPSGCRCARCINEVKTNCPQGHPYDEENTLIDASTGSRRCRECNKIQCHNNYEKRKLK